MRVLAVVALGPALGALLATFGCGGPAFTATGADAGATEGGVDGAPLVDAGLDASPRDGAPGDSAARASLELEFDNVVCDPSMRAPTIPTRVDPCSTDGGHPALCDDFDEGTSIGPFWQLVTQGTNTGSCLAPIILNLKADAISPPNVLLTGTGTTACSALSWTSAPATVPTGGMGCQFWTHHDPIAFSSQFSFFAIGTTSASFDGVVLLWTPDAGKLTGTLSLVESHAGVGTPLKQIPGLTLDLFHAFGVSLSTAQATLQVDQYPLMVEALTSPIAATTFVVRVGIIGD